MYIDVDCTVEKDWRGPMAMEGRRADREDSDIILGEILSRGDDEMQKLILFDELPDTDMCVKDLEFEDGKDAEKGHDLQHEEAEPCGFVAESQGHQGVYNHRVCTKTFPQCLVTAEIIVYNGEDPAHCVMEGGTQTLSLMDVPGKLPVVRDTESTLR